DVQRDIAVGLVAARAHRNVLRESGWQGRHRWGDELRLSVLVLADKPQAIRYRLRAAAVLGVVADLDFVAAQRLQLPAMGMLLQRRRVLAIENVQRLVGRRGGGKHTGANRRGTEQG